MFERGNHGVVLGVAAGAAVAAGNLFVPAAGAAVNEHNVLRATREGALTRVGGHAVQSAGPDLPASLAAANQALDEVLDAAGPDSCVADEIGQALGVTGTTGRAEFVTADNIDLVKKEGAGNKKYPGEVGCAGPAPVKVANPNRNSAAFVIAAKEVPAGSAGRMQKTRSGLVLPNAVMGAAGENILFRPGLHLPRKTISSAVNLDVGYGVLAGVREYAGPLEHAGSTLQCADGSVISTAGNAEAISSALASIQNGSFAVMGKHLSAASFQAAFNSYLTQAEAQVKTAASGPAAPAPSCPPESGPVTPPSQPPPSGDFLVPGSIGVDISWPQCGEALPAGFAFGFVGVNDGLPYSTNPCLEEQAAGFANLGYYFNTAWNPESSHIDPDSPNACEAADENCLAYNYGYNAALDSLDAIASEDLPAPIVVALDVETINTWSDDPVQNQNSIQGFFDALKDRGVAHVIIYSTTEMWDDITGGWKPMLEEWGATVEQTPEAAAQYCTPEHEYAGGKVVEIQYIVTLPSGEQRDEDYVCQPY